MRRPGKAATALGAMTAALIAFAPTPSTAGTVKGTVMLAGKAPKKTPIKIKANLPECKAKPIYDESLVVGKKGGLANAVVSIDGAVSAKSATKGRILLDQKDCIFKPHVLAARVGDKLTVVNSDPFLNTPHAYMGRKTLFNIAQPFEGMKSTRKLKKAGLVSIKCDVHEWEAAYVKVFAHPYFAVTGKDGAFTIPGVPAGTYPVKVWHEKLGEKSGEVTVSSSGDVAVTLSYD